MTRLRCDQTSAWPALQALYAASGKNFDLKAAFDHLAYPGRHSGLIWEKGNVVTVWLDQRQWENWLAWRRRHREAVDGLDIRLGEADAAVDERA